LVRKGATLSLLSPLEIIREKEGKVPSGGGDGMKDLISIRKTQLEQKGRQHHNLDYEKKKIGKLGLDPSEKKRGLFIYFQGGCTII